jgi:prepilin-type processing-associated H-X9-DG protein
MNYLGIGGNYVAGWCKSPAYRKVTQIRYPSEQLAFAESQNASTDYLYPDGNSITGYYSVCVWSGVESGFAFRHLGTVNIAYPDGHVKSKKRADIPSRSASSDEAGQIFWCNPL